MRSSPQEQPITCYSLRWRKDLLCLASLPTSVHHITTMFLWFCWSVMVHRLLYLELRVEFSFRRMLQLLSFWETFSGVLLSSDCCHLVRGAFSFTRRREPGVFLNRKWVYSVARKIMRQLSGCSTEGIQRFWRALRSFVCKLIRRRRFLLFLSRFSQAGRSRGVVKRWICEWYLLPWTSKF